MGNSEEERAIEPEVIEPSTDLVRPSTPINVNELASLEGTRGLHIVEQRTQILETLRVAALKLTMPNDWVLFKSPDGAVTGFLQDSGCDRVKKLFGIQIDNLGDMELIEDSEAKEFAFSIKGEGHCALTGEHVYDMEGVRYSTEPFAQQKPEGIQRRVAVQKAARANLDGGITRELTGLKSVPVEELTKAWDGSWKKWEMCSKGRGFGTGEQRIGAGGATSGGLDAADIPTCSVCKDEPKLVFRPAKGDRAAFWGCKNYESHPKDKVFIDHAKLLAEIAKRKEKDDK